MKLNIVNKKYDAAIKLIEDRGYGRLAMRYAKTKGVFSASNTAIDLVRETGHSYGWYELFKRINGALVLNTYAYSSATSGHYSKARRVLNALKIKFIEIEAPRGLQDLDSAKSRALEIYGREAVKFQRSRTKSRHGIKAAIKLVDNCLFIGIKISQAELDKAIKKAEADHVSKLAKAKVRRDQLKEKQRALESVTYGNGYQLIS